MEKKIIEGKSANITAIASAIFIVIAGVVNLAGFIVCYIQSLSDYCFVEPPLLDRVISTWEDYAPSFAMLCLIGAIFSLLFYAKHGKTELIVTDKRVYGKTSFGKRVDLPLDSISAVGTAMLKSISVTTASGAIKFSMIANRDDVYSKINNLLIERQENKVAAAPIVRQETFSGNAAELKQYKELLDAGIITQEEFDAKKKQLLDL